MTQQDIDQFREEMEIFEQLLDDTTNGDQRMIFERARMRTLYEFYEKLNAYEPN